MAVKIVPIEEKHIQGFWDCLDTVARERLWLGTFEGYPIESTRAFVTRMIEQDNPQFVALDGEKVVGWIDISPGGLPLSAHVGTLGMGLLSDYRGQGLGRQLMHTALEKARQKGLKRIELSVYPHNQAGIALYEKVGFKHEGARAKAAKLDQGYVDILMMGLWVGD